MTIAVYEAILSGVIGVVVASIIYYVGVLVRFLNRIDHTRIKRESIAIEDGIRKAKHEARRGDEDPPSGDRETQR